MDIVPRRRLFFALVPDESTRDALRAAVREVVIATNPSGRMLPAESYHLTLSFLGELSSAEEAAARRAAESTFAPPFEVLLDHASSFRAARAWCLGARVIPSALLHLRTTLTDNLAAAGLAPDRRRFVPHVTFARDVHGALAMKAVEPVAWPAHSFALMVSVGTFRYEVVSRWPLRAPPAQLDLLGT